MLQGICSLENILVVVYISWVQFNLQTRVKMRVCLRDCVMTLCLQGIPELSYYLVVDVRTWFFI